MLSLHLVLAATASLRLAPSEINNLQIGTMIGCNMVMFRKWKRDGFRFVAACKITVT